MPKSQAIQTARSILSKFDYTTPVDVEAIAVQHAVRVVREDFEDSVSGVLVIKDNQGIIGVNTNHHPNRQRFTIAHELGHYLLHPGESGVFMDRSPVFFRDSSSSEGGDQREREANAFAAELLMPREDLTELLEGRHIDAFNEVSVRRLSARFGVSAQALTIRLTTLGFVTEF